MSAAASEFDSRPSAVVARIERLTNSDTYGRRVYTIPEHLDEKVARLHLDAPGVKLTTLTDSQAEYLGIAVEGPYKPDPYRY